MSLVDELARDRNVLPNLSASLIRRSYYLGTFLIVSALVGVPLAFYFWGSVWSEAPGLGGHFTLQGYELIFRPQVYQTILNTFIIAVVGTILALLIGISAMLLSIKTDIPGGRFISLILIVQYLLPSYIVALSWDFYAGSQGALNQLLIALPFFDSPPINIYSLWGIALVGAAHYAGLIYLLSSGAVRSVPVSMEEMAQMAGASTLTVFRRITLRLAIPALAISAVLVFTRLLQSFGLPLILGIPGDIYVVATHMYYSLTQFPPEFAFASALGVVILLMSVGGLVVQRKITGKREKYETIVGKGDVTRTLKFNLGKYSPVITVAFFAFLIGIYVIPYLIMFINSFQAGYAGLNLSQAQWTLDNYRTLLVGTRAQSFYEALINTLVISGVGAFFGMIIASLASYIIVKSDSPIGDVLDFLTLTPAAIPGIIVATAFLWLFLTYNFLGLYGTIWIIMLALTARFIVYGTRATNSSFNAIGSELEEAAEISGASLPYIFKEIFIPLVKPGFLSGYVLLFIDYMKVLTIPLLLAGSGNRVLSTLLWDVGVIGNAQVGAAIATIMVGIICLVYFLVNQFTKIDISGI